MKTAIALLALVTLPAAADKPPNLVFILADDLGITDIGAYARHFNKVSPDELFYETPHLDKLVADGIAFSQSYANQLCSPTRAAVLTGRIASRMGVTTATPNTKTYFNQGKKVPKGHAPHDVLKHEDPIPGKRPWINASSNTGLDPSIPTWPRVLKSHGCAFLGKWHLGGHGVPELQPAAHGFEELAFFDAGGSPYFKWQAQWDRAKPLYPTMPGKFRIGKAGGPTDRLYLTDDLSARAVAYLQSRKAGNKPFVLYYCPFAVHTPFQAPEKTVNHFAAKKQRGHLGRDNATYAAMLKHLDDSVGEIRATLEETGLAKNTVLIFTSDNGGVTYTDPAATTNPPFKGGKACLYEGGVRVPTVVWQPGRFEGGKWCDAVTDCTDFLPTVARANRKPAPGKSRRPQHAAASDKPHIPRPGTHLDLALSVQRVGETSRQRPPALPALRHPRGRPQADLGLAWQTRTLRHAEGPRRIERSLTEDAGTDSQAPHTAQTMAQGKRRSALLAETG